MGGGSRKLAEGITNMEGSSLREPARLLIPNAHGKAADSASESVDYNTSEESSFVVLHLQSWKNCALLCKWLGGSDGQKG